MDYYHVTLPVNLRNLASRIIASSGESKIQKIDNGYLRNPRTGELYSSVRIHYLGELPPWEVYLACGAIPDFKAPGNWLFPVEAIEEEKIRSREDLEFLTRLQAIRRSHAMAIEFKIVVASSWEDFQLSVERMLALGWTPLGGHTAITWETRNYSFSEAPVIDTQFEYSICMTRVAMDLI